MKKTLIVLLIIVMMLSIAVSSYAVETDGETQVETKESTPEDSTNVEADEDKKVEATTPKAEVKISAVETDSKNTVKIVLSLGNFTNMKENAMIGYEAKLSYKEDIFEKVEAKDVKGLNGWVASYSPTTKTIIGDPIIGKANTKIAEITLTLKNGVQGEKATVSLTNFLLSDDDENELFTQNLSTEITIKAQEEQQQQPKPEEPNGEPTKKDETYKGTQNPAKGPLDTTIASINQLPKAGKAIIMISIVVVMIFIVIGVISGKGYITYLKDTHKQLKK